MKNKKIKLLAWGDSPNCSTGFATVTKNILYYLVKTGKYEVTVIGINDRGGWHNPFIYPYKIYPAKIGIDIVGGDFHGRDRLIATMLGKDPDVKFPFDIVFTLNDPFILEQDIPIFRKGTLEVLKEAQEITKKKLPPNYWFKIVSYWPIDSSIRPHWSNTIALSDYPIAYCDYGKKEIIKASIGEKSFDDIQKKLTSIYHGISLKNFFPIDKKDASDFRQKFFGGVVKDSTFLIISVARNQLRKDMPRTLAIFSEFLKRRPDSFLYLHAQETDSWGSLREYASNFKNLEFSVNWGVPTKFSANEGYPVDMMNMIYNAADCVLSTTLGEGFGFYNLEGMATKTLVVAPNNTCYSEDTKVFTLDGIKGYKEVKVGDLVWTFNLSNKRMEAKRVLKVVEYDYSGNMIALRSKKVNLLVTPNHQVLLRKRGEKNYQYVRADSIPSQFNLPVIANWVGNTPSERYEGIPIKKFLMLAGWYLSEGFLTHDKQYPKTTRVTICEPEGGRYRDEVEKLLRDLGVKFYTTYKKDGVRFSNYKIFKLLLQFGEGSKNKKIPRWILNLDKKFLQIIFDALINGDGATANNVNYRKVYITVSKVLAEGISEIAFKLGFNPKIVLIQSKESFIHGRKIYGGVCYRIVFRKTKGCLKRYGGNIFKEKYSGKIWCFEMEDNHNLLVGRNNLFAFCGNTHPELFGYNSKDDITNMDKIYKNLRGVPMLCGETKTSWATFGQIDYERLRPLTNVEDGVKKLLWVYDNPEKAEDIENRAYEWVKQFNWPIVGKQWDDMLQKVYNDLLKEREEYGNRPKPVEVNPADSKPTDSK